MTQIRLPGRRKVYVASSWRNVAQPVVVEAIRKMGHEVYDFRNPAEGIAFHWSKIDGDWRQWDAKRYVKALHHPIAEAGFKGDFDAMQWADTFVLVQPCGRSAHLEMGWAVGAGKATIMLLGPDIEPELMVKMCDHICVGLGSMLELFEMYCEDCGYEQEYVYLVTIGDGSPGNEWKLISIHESLFGVKGAYRAVEEYERKHQHSFCKIETWEVIK